MLRSPNTNLRSANTIYWALRLMTEFIERAIAESELQLKVPDPFHKGAFTTGAPKVYASYIPSDETAEPDTDRTQETPSVLVTMDNGSVDLKAQRYEISFTLQLSVWDDAPDYGASQDLNNLIDTIYSALVRNRTIGNRFRLMETLDWNILDNPQRTVNFVGIITGKLFAGIAADKTDGWL